MPKTLQEIEREGNAQVVAHIMGRDVTRGELLAAFNVVAPKPNWKAEINARAELDEFGVNLTQEAVIFFTGGPAIFDQVRPPVNGKAIYQISAPGYYAICGSIGERVMRNKIGLGDLVYDKADERHTGRIVAIRNTIYADVRWGETGWLTENLMIADLVLVEKRQRTLPFDR